MSNEAKHTPGPWTVLETPADGYCIDHNDGNLMRTFLAVKVWEKENAELIAKAPEMAAEIERLKSQLKDYCNDCQHPTVNERQAAELSKLRQENERYKEALQCMMNVEHHGDFMNAFFDLKEQVEAALKGE